MLFALPCGAMQSPQLGVKLNLPPVSSLSPDKTTLLCTDGKLVVANDKLKNLEVLYNCNADTQSTREFGNIFVVDYPIETMQSLLNGAVGVTEDKLLDVFHAADKYGLSKKFIQPLADQIDQQYDLEKDPNLKLNVLIYKERTLETLKRLGLEVEIKDGRRIDLANKKLTTLQGIRNLIKTPLYKKLLNSQEISEWSITSLILDNNKLKKLNPAELKKIFPNLKLISARNNSIKELDIKSVPDAMILDLYNNKITKIKTANTFFYNSPQSCIIDLSSNKLSPSELTKLQTLCTESMWQLLKKLPLIFPAGLFPQITGIALTAGVAGFPLISSIFGILALIGFSELTLHQLSLFDLNNFINNFQSSTIINDNQHPDDNSQDQ